jgi:hypothetical protein
MATASVNYSSNSSITCGVASTASSATFVAGRESNEVSNTTNLFIDAMVRGKVTVGTTPTANTQINIYVWGSNVSLATTAIDTLDGTDSAETLTNTGVLFSALARLATITVTAATSDIGYDFPPSSVCGALGLQVLPKFWGLFVAHNTGVALNATGGNHFFEYVGTKLDVA